MALSFVGSSVETAKETTGISGVTVPRPTGVMSGDVLLALVQVDAASGRISTPSGWTLVNSQVADPPGATYLFVRVAGSSEPSSYTFSTTSSPFYSRLVGAIVAYRGVDQAAPIDAHAFDNTGTTTQTKTAPSVTTTTEAMVVRIFSGERGPWSTPTGHTERVNGGQDGELYAGGFDVLQVSPGATGTASSTSISSTYATTVTVALRFGNAAPNAPILVAPADASTVDRNVSQRFDWDFSDPDPGDSQSAYNFRYREVGAATWTETGWQASTQTYHDVSGGTFTDEVDYEWQAATKDAQGEVGPFSPSWFFTAGAAPMPPTITAPTNGGTFTQAEILSWSAPEQDAYQIRVMDGTTVETDTGTVTSSTARSASVEFPTNGVTRTIQLRISDGGLWSQWVEVTGTVSWLAPPAPTFTLAADDASGSLGISISNPAPSGSEPAASYNDVYVDDGAGEFRLATNVAPNGSVTYWLPKSGRDYSGNVRVRAIAENGVYADS